MKLVHYWRLFRKMPWSFKKMLVVTTWQSLIAEVNLKLNRTHVFQAYRNNLPETKIERAEQIILIKRMRKIMRMLEKRAPWTPMCYNRALTAKRLLRAANIETTLHVGFKPRQAVEEFEGHAWLTINEFFITGKIPQLHLYKELQPIIKAEKSDY